MHCALILASMALSAWLTPAYGMDGTFTAKPGQAIPIGVFTMHDYNCDFAGLAQVRVLQPPKNGQVDTRTMTFTSNEQRLVSGGDAPCSTKGTQQKGTVVIYQSGRSFRGTDVIRYRVTFEHGSSYTYTATVTVK